MNKSMKANVECHWEDSKGKKQQGNITISFEKVPPRLFKGLKKKDSALLRGFLEMPDFPALKELEKVYENGCESVALATTIVKGLQFFEFEDEANAFLLELKEKWPNELLVQTTDGLVNLTKNDPKQIPDIFSNHFVLKPCYPKRKNFHYSEAVSFHNIWGMYYSAIKNEEKAKKQFDFCRYLVELSSIGLKPSPMGS